MSSNQDLFLNQFNGQQSREAPPPVQTEMPNLQLPTSVPMVHPVNVVPDNLGDIQKYSQLSQLSKALGGVEVGVGGLASQALRIAEKHREQQQAYAYNQGLVEATTRAAKTRDIYGDVAKNGMIPANKNPWYVMGYQALLHQELASQYRSELVKARMENPLADPTTTQDQVKQKYLPLLQGARPDVAVKFFVEPSMKADTDDAQEFEKAQSKKLEDDFKRTAGASVGNTLQSDISLYQQKSISIDQLQANLIKSVESPLQMSYAIGKDYNTQVGAILETVENNASLLTNKDGSPASMKDKLAILDSLKGVKLPTGMALLADGDYAKKFREARERIVNGSYEQDKLAGEAIDGRVKQNTQKYKIMMGDDVKGNGLKPLSYYLKLVPPGEAVDPVALSQAYGALDSHSTSLQTQTETVNERDMATDVHVNHAGPEDIQRNYGSLVGKGVDPGKFASALSTADANQRHKQEQLKQQPVPVGEMNVYLNQVHPIIHSRHAAGRWSGYGKEHVEQGVSKDLKSIYEQEFRRQYLQKQAENPQGAQNPQTRMNWMQDIWNKLQSPLLEDYKHVQNQDYANYSDFIGRNRFGNGPKVATASEPPQSNAPKTVSAFAAQYPYAVNQQTFQQENELFKQRKGKAYQFMAQAAGDKKDYFWRKYIQLNPQQPVMGIVEYLQSIGKPTFLGQRKPQAANNVRR